MPPSAWAPDPDQPGDGLQTTSSAATRSGEPPGQTASSDVVIPPRTVDDGAGATRLGPETGATARRSDAARLGRQRLLLIVNILAIAFGLRIYDIAHNPIEIFEDEISDSESAWSIVTTGHDVERTRLPFMVSRLEMKLPIYGLSAAGMRAIVGKGALAIRLPAVLAGIAATWFVIWLMRALRRDWAESLIAGGLFAIVPWSVHYGRIGWATSAMLPFTVAGLGLLWIGLARRGQRGKIIGGALVLAVGAYTYTIAPLMHVVLAGVAVACHFQVVHTRVGRRAIGFGALVGFAIMLPYLHATLTEPFFTQRAKHISIFRDGVTSDAVGLAWNHYWAQWNPEWLFLRSPGGLRLDPGVAMLFTWMAPFLLVGLIRAVTRRDRADLFLLGWLIVAPLPAALTDDGVPHFARGLLALPPLTMLTATGMVWAWQVYRRRWPPLAIPLAAIVSVIAIGQAAASYQYIYTDYPFDSADTWYFGTGTALRVAGAQTPADGTLCIHYDAVSYFNFWHYVNFYLEDRSFEVVEGLGDQRCAEDGAVLLGRMDMKPPAPTLGVVAVADIRGNPSFRIDVVDRTSQGPAGVMVQES